MNSRLSKRLNEFETVHGEKVNNALTVLAITYLAVYSMQVLSQPNGSFASVLDACSIIIYSIFAADFLYRIIIHLSLPAEKRSNRTFIISMVLPALALLAPAFRALRLFRVVVAVRGFVGLVKNRAEQTGLLVLMAFPLLAYVSALAILDVEQYAKGSNIHSLKDALWWSLITMTTVGYGDHYPVTDEGKLIASGLLVTGIIIFSTITAIVSSWILTPVKDASK